MDGAGDLTMEFIGALLGLVVEPVSLAVVVLVIAVFLIFKGLLVPRSQVVSLIEQHEARHKSEAEMISLVREDRAHSVDAITKQRDLWMNAANDAQDVAQEVRTQNRSLIDRLSALDHLIDELRKATGTGGKDEE